MGKIEAIKNGISYRYATNILLSIIATIISYGVLRAENRIDSIEKILNERTRILDSLEIDIRYIKVSVDELKKKGGL